MVLYRSGRMSKSKQIKKVLELAHNWDEAFSLLQRSELKLDIPEITQIANDWDAIQKMLARHNKGAYATPEQAVV